MKQTKKQWCTPSLTVYGTAEKVTGQVKSKTPGGTDDFGVPGISSP